MIRQERYDSFTGIDCVSVMLVKTAIKIETVHWCTTSFPKDMPKAKTMRIPPTIMTSVITQATVAPINGIPFVRLKCKTNKLMKW